MIRQMLTGLSLTFRTLFRRPVTVQYPEQKLSFAPRYRGIHEFELNKCIACDLCVKACGDSHGGVSRLVRDGPRFDRYLIAGACRSCTDPYCLVGCPVDAIHREGSLETVIEDHCIGCGQCARNCPYNAIHMVSVGTGVAAQRLAVSCDLCRDVVRHPGSDEVRCVYSCPHHAAFRISGDELWQRLAGAKG